MFDDYYSFHPTFQLKEHHYVTSFFGTPLPQASRFFQTLSGVPVIDIERLLEHELGSRLAHYNQRHHRDELHKIECSLLMKVAKEQPSLVVLRPSTLRYRKSRNFLQEKSGIVLQQSQYILQEELDRIYKLNVRERFWDLDLSLPLTPKQLLAEKIVWKRYIPSKWHSVEISKLTSLDLGRYLIQLCEQL